MARFLLQREIFLSLAKSSLIRGRINSAGQERDYGSGDIAGKKQPQVNPLAAALVVPARCLPFR